MTNYVGSGVMRKRG